MGRGKPAPTLLHFIFKDHQSRGSGHTVVPVAAATVETDCQTQPSLPRLRGAIIAPVLKSRARVTWSLRDREGDCYIYFSMTISRRSGKPSSTALEVKPQGELNHAPARVVR